MYSLVIIFILQYFLKELHGLSEDYIEKEKKALRYGFHQTYPCQNFEKAFKCIRKCLDTKFDVAYADKNCDCTCYHKKEKEKYRALKGKGETPPTTKLPVWAQSIVTLEDETTEKEDNVVVIELADGTTTFDSTLAGNNTDAKNATKNANAGDNVDAATEVGLEESEAKGEGEGEGGGEGEGEGEGAGEGEGGGEGEGKGEGDGEGEGEGEQPEGEGEGDAEAE